MIKISVIRATASVIATSAILANLLFPAAAFSQSLCPQFASKQTRNNSSIAFERNLGQFDPQVIFAGRGNGQKVFLTADEATFVVPMPSAKPIMEDERFKMQAADRPDADRKEPREIYALKMRFAGANSAGQTSFENEIGGVYSYFKGHDPSSWVTGVERYSRAVVKDVYQGIDVAWYGNERGVMEFDMIVSPKSDPGQIDLEFNGADRLTVDESGDLLIETPAGTLRQGKPIIYQVVDGLRQPVEGGFKLNGNRAAFDLGAYDRSRELVIDPPIPLVYSTYFGGGGADRLLSIDMAPNSNSIYLAGDTQSSDFPQTYGVSLGGNEAFVTKLNPDNSIAYSAILSGTGEEVVNSVAVDAYGSAYAVGHTRSSNFPTSSTAYDKTLGGIQDIFVTKINPAGTGLSYSTFIGGSNEEIAYCIDIDSSGSAYLSGVTASTNYPVSTTAFDKSLNGLQDAFVTKLSPAGNSLLYSTYLGATNPDVGRGIVVDSGGNAYVTGQTTGSAFPVTPGAYHSSQSGPVNDAFVTKFNSNASGVIFSSVFGGTSEDVANAIRLDASGNVYITGTTSSQNFPTTFGAADTSLGALKAAFVTKLSSNGSTLLYSTFLDGTDHYTYTYGADIRVNSIGDVYVSGSTDSTHFPVKPNAYDTSFNGWNDAFLTKLRPQAFTGLLQSTYLGGTSSDTASKMELTAINDVYVAGMTLSSDFPTTPGAFDPTLGTSWMKGFISCFNNDWLGD